VAAGDVAMSCGQFPVPFVVTRGAAEWADILQASRDAVAGPFPKEWLRPMSISQPVTGGNSEPRGGIVDAQGPHSGIKQLHAIQQQVPMKEYFLFHATLADFCRRAGLTREARDAYQRAVQFAGSDAERRFLLGKLETLE